MHSPWGRRASKEEKAIESEGQAEGTEKTCQLKRTKTRPKPPGGIS